MSSPRVYQFEIPWTRPPISLNDRLHYRTEATRVKMMRQYACTIAHDIPFMDRIQVELTWVVADRRRRDDENPVPVLKALCDGLVDADIVPDDTHEFMVKRMPVIEYRKGATAHFVLTITELKD